MVFSGNDFDWKNGRGRSTVGRLGVTRFPESFLVKSPRTNAVMAFTADHETNVANEFFDGEGNAYRSVEGVTIQIWN